jgi:hypothetical protein
MKVRVDGVVENLEVLACPIKDWREHHSTVTGIINARHVTIINQNQKDISDEQVFRTKRSP